jgi:hypothetical protein
MTLAAIIAVPAAQAHVSRVVIDSAVPYTLPSGSVAYTSLSGRIFGTLNPNDPHNTIIQDIQLAPRDANGLVDYIATFQLLVPASPNGLMFYDVPNRGGNAIPGAAFDPGAVYLQSGWQGDILALSCAGPYPCTNLAQPYTGTQQVIQVPVAHQPNGGTITGPVYSHIRLGQSGTTGQLVIFENPAPYLPATFDTTKALFWSVSKQSITGLQQSDFQLIQPGQWSFNCDGPPAAGQTPFYICYNAGFDPNRLYQMVYQAKNPLVLGVGYAATRDIISFFHRSAHDDSNDANPVAGMVQKVIAYGVSQSGAFLRSSIHLGFNEDEQGRQVVDGSWPDIDGRQLYMNTRFALPDVITNLYMMADEAPVWWGEYPDVVRLIGPESMLDRCRRSNTCPQILETFGSDELYEEKMSRDLVGDTAQGDIPLPSIVHRYYFPSTTHGGGSDSAAFTWAPPPAAPVAPSPTTCAYPSNPNPESDQLAALQADFVAFLTSGTPMPPDAYPRIADGTLVPPTSQSVGFPPIPGYAYGGSGINLAEAFYFGPHVNYRDQIGVIDFEPPLTYFVEPARVPPVNTDGNEIAGVPSVTLQVPLATYSGWKLYSGGPFQGQQCSLSGSAWSFQETLAARQAAGDPRPSLEERYGTHSGYVCAITTATKSAVSQGFLLPSAATTLIGDAQASNVLSGVSATSADQARAASLCTGQ